MLRYSRGSYPCPYHGTSSLADAARRLMRLSFIPYSNCGVELKNFLAESMKNTFKGFLTLRTYIRPVRPGASLWSLHQRFLFLSDSARIKQIDQALARLEELVALRVSLVQHYGEQSLKKLLFSTKYHIDLAKYSPDPSVRANAMWKLSHLGPGNAFTNNIREQWVRDAWLSQDGDVQLDLASAALHMPLDERISSVLVAWAGESPHERVRRYAAKSLQNYGGDPTALYALERALRDPSSKVREAAANSLDEIEAMKHSKVEGGGK